MRSRVVPVLIRIPRIALLLFLGIGPATAQTPTRVIEWQKFPFGRITKVAEGMCLSPVVEALEIVDFTVEGKSVTLGESFTAGDEWLKSLKVRVHNISGQTITRAQMNFVLIDGEIEGGEKVMVLLKYGSVPSEHPRPIPAGESFELEMTEWDYRRLSERVARSKNPGGMNRLLITVTSAHFDDGCSWASGCLRGTKPENSCPLIAA